MSATFEQLLADIVRRVVREELAAIAKPITGDKITIAAYAAARSISPSTVRAAIRDGRLAAMKVGRSVRVPADAEIGVQVHASPAKQTPATIADRVLGLVNGGRP